MDQMNLSNLSSSTPALPKSTNRNGRISWPKSSSIKQSFSFPDSIIYYISKKPSSPEVYLKLAQSCKYFFEKLSLLVVKRIHRGGRKLCSSNSHKECYYKFEKCCVNADYAKMTSKIWLIDELNLFHDIIPNISAAVIPKLYRCENAQLTLVNGRIKLDNFKKLGSKFQNYYFSSFEIADNNGNEVMLDKILEAIPNVKKFEYGFCPFEPNATTSTMKNILKLSNFGNLEKFTLYSISEVFAIEDIAEFIKNHRNADLKLSFFWNTSDAYKTQLNGLIDTVIASGFHKCLLFYYGQDQKKYKIMYNNCERK